MYVCMCKRLTDGDIRQSVFQGRVACMDSLRDNLGASTGCGCCAMVAQECLADALEEKRRVDRTCRDNPVGGSGQEDSPTQPGFFEEAPQPSYS